MNSERRRGGRHTREREGRDIGQRVLRVVQTVVVLAWGLFVNVQKVQKGKGKC